MTGNTATQGDVLEAEEVVSLLLDDAEMEAKIKEQVSKQAVSFSRLHMASEDHITSKICFNFLFK
jgi:hypothetical protein